MQVTLDLPDDVFAKAEALAREQSRSLGSVLADLIRGVEPEPRPAFELAPLLPGHRFPVIEGSRPFTVEEIDRMLEEDGLP